jgi:SAM-dependent methyltransferase
MKIAPFDTPDTLLYNEARKVFLETLLPNLVSEGSITTALDVGCGFGFFSGYLQECGLKVMAIDGRPENVAEARRRYPDVEIKVCDVEDPSMVSLGRSDLVLCFGLLYHLENPFRAVRNLASITGKVLLVETVIAPTRSLATFLYEEDQKLDQGLNYIALIPTESWFVKCFYRAGFPFVYKTMTLPNHEYFYSSLIKKRRRTVLVASKVKLFCPLLRVAPEPKTYRYMWDSFRLGSIFGSERVRKILRSGLRLFSDSYRREGQDNS